MILDSPIGTRLINEHGLAPGDVLFANLHHADWVRALHRRDVDAGAEIVLTNTFALPFRAAELSNAEIDALMTAAIAHAESAAPKAVHISLGPAILGDEAGRERVLTCAVAAAKRTRASGLWFESLSIADLSWLVHVMSSLVQNDIPVACSFIAGDEGDLSFAPSLAPAWATGFNCARVLPVTDDAILATAERWLAAPLREGQRRIAKPAGPLSQATRRSLATRFDLFGLCCGGTDADLRGVA